MVGCCWKNREKGEIPRFLAKNNMYNKHVFFGGNFNVHHFLKDFPKMSRTIFQNASRFREVGTQTVACTVGSSVKLSPYLTMTESRVVIKVPLVIGIKIGKTLRRNKISFRYNAETNEWSG
jgi:hypothetical protein